MKAKARPDLQIIPMLAHESLYIGVDIGKFKHIAGFVSTTLLARFQRFEGCPALVFEQSREGFRALVDRIGAYVPIQQAYVLLERDFPLSSCLAAISPRNGDFCFCHPCATSSRWHAQK